MNESENPTLRNAPSLLNYFVRSIIAPVLIVSALLVFSTYTLIMIVNDADENTLHVTPVVNTAYEIEINTIGGGLGILRYVHSAGNVGVDRFYEDISELRDFLEKYNTSAPIPQVSDEMQRLESLIIKYEQTGRKLIENVDMMKALSLEIEAFSKLRLLENIAHPSSEALHPAIDAANGISLDLYQTTIQELLFIFDDETDLRELDSQLDSMLVRQQAVKSQLSPVDSQGWENLKSLLDQQKVEIQFLQKLLLLRQTQKELLSDLFNLRDDIDDLLDDAIQNQLSSRQSALLNDIHARSTFLQNTTFVLLLLLTVAVAISWAMFRRSVLRPIFKLGRLAQLHAKEDPTVHETLDGPREIADTLSMVHAVIEQNDALRNDLQKHNDTLEETVRKRTQAMEEAKEVAERASRAKTLFMSNMSHELRTPLNAILGFSDIVEKRVQDLDTDEDLASYMRMISSGAQRLLSSTNNILDMTRIDLREFEVQKDEANIFEILDGCRAQIDQVANEKSINVLWEMQPDMPAVIGDNARLGQALLNVLDNAIKFSPRGGDVTCYARQNGNSVEIVISDNGDGIPEDNLAHIMEPFSQADCSYNRAYEGVGLGLSIAKHIVERHGGVLEIASESEMGTSVTINLPFDETNNAQQIPKTAPVACVARQSDNGVAAASDQKGLRILIVEDNNVNAMVLKSFVNAIADYVRIAEDGRLGVKAVKEEPFDIILMDKHMPVMNGIEACREIRALDGPECNVPIIAVTADNSDASRNEALACGMNGFVSKPVTAPAICEAVLSLLSQSEQTENVEMRVGA